MNFNLDNQDFINNEFQNLIFKIKSLANDINQNNDKNANLSQLQNILNNIQYLNKKVIEEINSNDAAPPLLSNENKIVTMMTEDGKYIGEEKTKAK